MKLVNVLDVVIVLFVLAALFRGQEVGFVRQFFSTLGFFGGLMLGALLEPGIVGLAHTPLSRAVISLVMTLGFALLLLLGGELLGAYLKRRFQFKNWLNYLDNSFGAGLAGVSFLATVWLGAAVLAVLPYPNLQAEIRDSKIVSLLNGQLPPAPNVIADIGRLIVPNGFPDVFIGAEPKPAQAALPTPAALATAVKRDRASVVKVEGRGCGGIVEGSGFVVSDGLVATNAHVVAGIASPYVFDSSGNPRPATAVWFDPDLDLAVLQVGGLSAPALPFGTVAATQGTPAGVLGYPGGGAFTADSAAVLSEFTAVGRNIYGQNTTERNVYSIKATVVPGNSGGPLVDTAGRVIGIVFATSTEYKDVGYALTIHQVQNEIAQAKANVHQVSTGSCAE